jgi:exodeoxyribonuclease V beta subunit
VQIVTIHKSKGLEYPIVFCPFLWGPETAPPSEDGADSAVYHDDDGELVIDWRKRFFDKDTDADVKRRLKLARAQETLRLIYVALTRGVHRCVIVAGCCLSQFGNNLTPNPSARSLLNWLVAGAGMTPDEWFKHEGGVPAIADAWWELAQSSHGTIAVLPLPLAPPEPLTTPRPAPESLAALAPPHPMPSAWWMGSFSSIAHGAVQEQSALDHDLRILADAAAAAPAPAPRLADDDILRFPRGPAAGECMHDVFERIDFTAPAGWPPAIAAALRLLRTMNAAKTRDEGNASADVDTDAAHVSMLRSMLADVLATPLPLGTAHPLRLSELPRSRRLVELEFHLPTHRLDATTLNEALAREGIDLPRLGFATLRGYLKGFIDLVFEHEGRYFVLDWKSNHLGDTPAAYERGPLASAMREQTYHLQYLLYLVALDRYLRTRLAGYDPDRHLGGAVYLFVRGVRPSWRDEDGTPCGVFFHRPAAATIRRLSALFDEAEVLS